MEPAEFAAIYRTHHPAVLKFLLRRTADSWLAEDIASETFVRAWKVIDRFEPSGGGMAAWLQRIARNILFDHASAAHVRHEYLSPYDAEAGWDPTLDRPDPAPGPAEVVVRMEASAAVRLAILRLPTDDQREAMLYRHVDGLSVRETAERMGKHPTAIKALCFRGTAGVAQELTGAVA